MDTSKDSTVKPTRYLAPNRLANVLALIQILGRSVQRQIYDSTLRGDQMKLWPLSESSWVSIAKEHPEFFRVSGENDDCIMLVRRYVLDQQLSEDAIGGLMEVAISAHDREVVRSQNLHARLDESKKMSLAMWSIIASATTSILATLVALAALFVKNR